MDKCFLDLKLICLLTFYVIMIFFLKLCPTNLYTTTKSLSKICILISYSGYSNGDSQLVCMFFSMFLCMLRLLGTHFDYSCWNGGNSVVDLFILEQYILPAGVPALIYYDTYPLNLNMNKIYIKIIN